jgi:DNA-binding NarL/FixJ family response regulator
MSDITQPFICALTANAMEGDDKECIAQGMNHYMSKPLFVATLVQAIRLAHAHKLARDVSPPNALASLPTVTASPPTTAASPVGPFISPPSSSSSFLSSYALTAGGVAALVPVVVTSHTSTSGALDMQQQQQQQCTSPPTSDQLA